MNIYINDNYWMNIVRAIAKASTCKVNIGTILIKNNKIVSHGFLGSISGQPHCCDDGCIEIDNDDKFGSSGSGKSCIRTIHSEMNAVLKCHERGDKLTGWLTCYTTFEPCLNCLKALLAIGVRNIVFEKLYRDMWRDKFYRTSNFSNIEYYKWDKD